MPSMTRPSWPKMIGYEMSTSFDQLAVLDDVTNGGHFGASIEPVRRIDFGDRVDGHPLNRQIPA